ncbi:MAG: DUF2382 domain-containing protein [Parerythrobacter sp.]
MTRRHSEPSAAISDRASGKTVEEHRIPVVEERVSTRKVIVEGDTVTVRTTPVETSEAVEADLLRETVDVTRVTVNEPIDAIPDTREEDGVTIVPVVEERLVTTRQLVLVEEIHVRRIRRTETVRENVPRVRTEVSIEKSSPNPQE